MFGRSEDRISNLNDALLIHILSFLEMKDAVRSSLLSRRWSNLWTFIPSLSFKRDDFKSRKSFKNFVTQVLLRRDKLDVVKVHYDGYSYLESSLLAESVVHYAVRHGVQELYLSIDHEDFPVVLPRCLIGCQSLQKLELEDSSHKISVPAYLGLNALKHLSLSGFGLWENEYLDSRAISSCPNLETLILHDFFHAVGTFHILAPNLRRLELVAHCTDPDLLTEIEFIVSAPRLNTFKFSSCTPAVCSMDCPSLERAIIDVDPDSDCHEIDESLCAHLVRLVNECRNAKSIKISVCTLKVLSAFPALLKEHHSTFGQLECLSLQREGECRTHRDFELPPCILTYFLNGSSSATVRVC